MDDFERHLDTQECGPKPEDPSCRIYDAKILSSWIRDSKDDNAIFDAQTLALDRVKERAMELGRQEWLEDPWGLSPEVLARRMRNRVDEGQRSLA